MEATKEQLDLVYLHMVKKFAGGKVVAAAPAEPTAPAAPAEPATAPQPGAPPTPAPALDGKPLYEKYCKGCHALDGSGSAGMKANNIPDLSTAEWQAGHDQAKIVEVLERGVDKTKMKAFKDKMSPEELAAVAAHVKQLKQP
jgi:mono/diheme cytochrome c family protein